MQKTIISTLIFLLTLTSVIAQAGLQPSPEAQAAMKKLHGMAGFWRGTGWIQMGPQRHEFNQTEDVQLKVNGSIVVVDGLGKDATDSTQIIHQVFAVISYDQQAGKYLMRAFRADGNYVDADFKFLEDGRIQWGFTHPMAGEVRYTIELTDKKWTEKGAMSRDGKSWMPFFEMNLEKRP